MRAGHRVVAKLRRRTGWHSAGANGRRRGRRLLARVDVGASAHDATSDSALDTGAQGSFHERLAFGPVLPVLFLNRLRQFLKQTLGGHATADALGSVQAGRQPSITSLGHGSLGGFKPELVSKAASTHRDHGITDTRSQRGNRVFALVGVVLAVFHLLAGLHGAFANTASHRGSHLLANCPFEVSGHRLARRAHGPLCKRLGCQPGLSHAAGRHQSLADCATGEHGRKRLDHLVGGVERVLQVLSRNATGILASLRRNVGPVLVRIGRNTLDTLPCFIDSLLAVVVAFGILGFLGPLAGLESGCLTDGIGRLGERPRAKGQRRREIRNARDDAGKLLNPGFQGSGDVAGRRLWLLWRERRPIDWLWFCLLDRWIRRREVVPVDFVAHGVFHAGTGTPFLTMYAFLSGPVSLVPSGYGACCPVPSSPVWVLYMVTFPVTGSVTAL